jgi:hypothetical protein
MAATASFLIAAGIRWDTPSRTAARRLPYHQAGMVCRRNLFGSWYPL